MFDRKEEGKCDVGSVLDEAALALGGAGQGCCLAGFSLNHPSPLARLRKGKLKSSNKQVLTLCTHPSLVTLPSDHLPALPIRHDFNAPLWIPVFQDLGKPDGIGCAFCAVSCVPLCEGGAEAEDTKGGGGHLVGLSGIRVSGREEREERNRRWLEIRT
jgi:hypothetical protein